MADSEAKLTHKQQLFVEAYLGVAKGNATEAARLAGYKQPQMHGSRLMKNDEIASRVRARVEAVGMTADEVLNELAAVARIPADYDPKSVQNKVKALELLGKHHKLFVEQVDVTSKGQILPVLNIYASETGRPASG